MYIFACLIVTLSCAAATLHARFDDNLAQRIGLGGVSICALALMGGVNVNAIEWLVYALALYCAGTIYKFWRREHDNTKRISDRSGA